MRKSTAPFRLPDAAYKITVTRHARHAMDKRGIDQLELVRVLHAPDSTVRMVDESGNFVLHNDDLRIALRLTDPSSLTVLTVYHAENASEISA